MASYIITTGALEALKAAGYATIIWVNSKVIHFTAIGPSQKCDASLTIQNGVFGNTILLSNSTEYNSYFENTVDFKKDISVKGKILNTNSGSSLDIKSTDNDLNMTSTRAINLYAGTQIAFNAPQVINSGNLKVDNINNNNNVLNISSASNLNLSSQTIINIDAPTINIGNANMSNTIYLNGTVINSLENWFDQFTTTNGFTTQVGI
jgi:hypothetical protein